MHFFAIPSANRQTRKEILDICKETGCKLRAIPGTYQLINGEVSVSKLQEVEIEDLLGREPINTNIDEIIGYVSGKVVMVTGGGGSIGRILVGFTALSVEIMTKRFTFHLSAACTTFQVPSTLFFSSPVTG